jgi:hypothetical protein
MTIPNGQIKEEIPSASIHQTWSAANQAYLQLHFRRLRLMLHRRILWLRKHWQSDSLGNTLGMIITDKEADWLLTGSDPILEASFYEEDSQAALITRSIAAMDQELKAHGGEMERAHTPPALEIMGRLFGLTPFEKDVLILCLAPSLDPAFERLYGYVQDDVNRKYPTIHLALALFSPAHDASISEAKTVFHLDAPLRRFSLIALGSGQSNHTMAATCALAVDERVVNYLHGMNRIDSRLDGLVAPIPPMPVSPSHEAIIEQLLRIYCNKRNTWPVLDLIGPPHAGKQALAGHLCNCLGLGLNRLLPDRLPPAADERGHIYRLLAREAVLMPMGFYVDTDPLPNDGQSAQPMIEEILKHLSAFIFLGGARHWQSTRPTLAIRMTRADRESQAALWRQVLENIPHRLDGHVEEIVQQFDFGPQAIVNAVTAARSRARLENEGKDAPLAPEDLWQACRDQAGAQLDDLAQRIVPCYGWEDIVLPQDTLCQLKEIAAQVALRHMVYETWGFGAKLSRGRGISALFAGPSGTGKTMAAEILANHLDLDLFRIDLAGVVSKYIGETEKNLKKVFDAAEQSGSILFFDEADALFGKRTEVKDSHDRYANIEVNYLLQRMEDFRGLAILATNRKSALDRAFLRRLRFLVDFPFPNAESRKTIWQKVFPKEATTTGLEIAALTRMEISGGNIRNIALNAAFLAADEQQTIGMAHVMRAARREYAKIDKMMSEGEFGAYDRNLKTKGGVGVA